MAYRTDSDLEFLSQCSDEDLNDLVYCLTHDKDGSTRFTEELTKTEAYKNITQAIVCTGKKLQLKFNVLVQTLSSH